MHFRTSAFICLSIASVVLAGPITSKYDAKAGPGVALVKKSASKVGKGYESSKQVWKGKKRAYGHGGDDDHGDDKDDGHDYDHGFEDGHRDAYKEGYADGKDKGYWKGFENGSKEGQLEGQKNGRAEGAQAGLDDGYWEGFENGEQDGEANGEKRGYDDGRGIGKKYGYNNGFKLGLAAALAERGTGNYKDLEKKFAYKTHSGGAGYGKGYKYLDNFKGYDLDSSKYGFKGGKFNKYGSAGISGFGDDSEFSSGFGLGLGSGKGYSSSSISDSYNSLNLGGNHGSLFGGSSWKGSSILKDKGEDEGEENDKDDGNDSKY